MATMAEITAAINQIDDKEQNLHKSFQHLQSQSPSSFILPFNWSDIDSHFTTLKSSLQSKFNLLQTFHPPPDPEPVPARPELISFCLNSDGLGLNRFIAFAPNQQSILPELPDAYRFALDAPAMVLDALYVFYSTGVKGTELNLFRNSCLIMLEGLLCVKPDIGIELKDKAMEIAVQWNRMRVSGPGVHTVLGFVLLVGAYGLVDQFSIDDIIDCFLIVATDEKTIDMCKRIIPKNNINDLIQNMIYKDMHVTAVKFIIQLEKTDEFSLVGLLEERKLRSMRVLEKKRKNAKYLDVWKGVTIVELSVLKSIIKCIDENHLEAEHLKDSVVEIVNKLENELENSTGLWRKQPTKSNMSKKSKVSKKQKRDEVEPTVESFADTTVQKSHLQKSDSSPDYVDECLSSPLGLGPTRSNPPSVKDSGVELVNEVENSKQTSANDLGLRKQPPRASVWKRQLESKSKKPKLNKVEPTVESFADTSVQKSHSQKSDLSPDHVDECLSSPLGLGPARSNPPSVKDSVVELVNEVENSKQTSVNDLGLRKQPPRAGVLKRQLESKSKKPKLNKVEPTVESFADTSVQKPHSQKSDLSPDHVDECMSSPLGLGPTRSNPPSVKDSVVQLVNEVENSKQTSENDRGLRKQPTRATVLKRQLESKSKKSKLNKVQPTADSAAATPVQSVKSIQESHSQKSDSLPDHGSDCQGSAVRSGPSVLKAPNASLITSRNGSTGADIGYNFYVPQLQPPSDCNSNGWISD